METLVMNIKVLLLTPKNSGSRPLGTFRAKKHPFLGLFLMIVKNTILYVVIGVFYGAEFNFTCPDT